MVGQLFQSNSKHLLVFILFLNCNLRDEFKILLRMVFFFFLARHIYFGWSFNTQNHSVK